MRRVLILDGSIWPEMYGPADQWRRLVGGVPADAVHVAAGEPVPDLAGYSHLVVTGSEASIVTPEPWFEVERDAVRRAVDRGMAVLGSCFGHQMLAVALMDGTHAVRSETPEMGWVPVEILAPDPLFEGLPDPVHVFVSHFDEVRDPPAPWKVLARSAGCDVQAMRLGDLPVWGIQAHPEIPPGEGRALLEGFLEKVPAARDLIEPALASEPRDDGAAASIVRRFLEH